VIFALVFPSVVTWVYFVLLAESLPALQKTAYGIGKTIQFAFPAFWVFVVARRMPRWIGPTGRGLAEGAVFGLLVLAATLLLYHLWLKPAGYFFEAAEPIRLKVTGFGVSGFWSFFALGAFYAIVHSFLEEYYFRWFVFGRLRQLVSFPTALVVGSLGFMAHHVIILATYLGLFSAGTILFSLAVAVGGAIWAWMYERTGSLWGPWVSHLLVDAAIFTVAYDLVRQLPSS
jgi:membrane protease YdiL (CAAX protease family)